MALIIYVFVSLFGLIIGSFLNVVIYRLPRHESIIHPGSHCPYCGNAIKPFDNIPVISYLILKGRCRYCKNKIPIRYPIVELTTAVLFTCLYIRYGMSIDTVVFFILGAGLIAITFIDLDHRIIPNAISYPGIVIGFVSSFFISTNNPINSIIGIFAGSGILFLTAFIYRAVTGVEGMGMGDVKLMAMIGAFLGWQASLFTIVISALVGSIVGVVLIVFMGKGRRYAIPYGPFISASAVIYLFYGKMLIDLYLRLVGYV
ncbi:MAG: prepilin peptidase [bacterium]